MGHSTLTASIIEASESVTAGGAVTTIASERAARAFIVSRIAVDGLTGCGAGVVVLGDSTSATGRVAGARLGRTTLGAGLLHSQGNKSQMMQWSTFDLTMAYYASGQKSGTVASISGYFGPYRSGFRRTSSAKPGSVRRSEEHTLNSSHTVLSRMPSSA